MRRLAVILLSCLLPMLAAAQERPNTILVLDGSGSMWGQIDGVNKIVIARDVVGGLLDDFPADQNLGLTVYGHRTEGDCTDIETVVAPGAETTGRIREAVNGINPRGRTPMTDAVIAAAEALGYTDTPATVILVSDGIETCNPDPCAAARALEQAGVDFTAHVIGFDVTDPEALAQMQCLAEETGGTFLTASNAAELTDAMTTAMADPEPVAQTVEFVAVAQPGGAEIADPVDWTVSGEIARNGTGPGFETDLTAGDYAVSGLRTTDGRAADATFTVPELTQPGTQRVEVVFPAPMLDLTFEARIGSVDGEIITDPVLWTLTGTEGVAEATGNPVTEEAAPGAYEVRAYWTVQETARTEQFTVMTEDRTVVVIFDAPLPTAVLTAPDSTPMGSTIEVGWDGPGAEGDYIAVSDPDTVARINTAYLEDGNPVRLLMPPEAGVFELRYIDRATGEVIGTRPITLTEVTATLTAPEEAVAGGEVEVGWTGPDYEGDYIGIHPVGEPGWETFFYIEAGSPGDLRMPTEPGAYEITYFIRQDRTPIGSVPITVTDVLASVTAPTEAIAGSDVEITWTGPDYEDDYIGVGPADGDGSELWNQFTYVRDGSPLTLRMPIGEGEHVITYFLRQDRQPLASAPITLTMPEATLTAPESATAGSEIEVTWTGPDYEDDYIGIGPADGEDSELWQNFTYTRSGTPLDLTMPTEPGDYLITYFLRQDRTPLVQVPITVTDLGGSITAPTEAVAGSDVEITWTGPDYEDDYIGVGPADGDGSELWNQFTYVRDGSPLTLRMPIGEGEHVITYFLRQDRQPLASAPITLTMPEATLTAPESATAGSEIEVGWTGPDYEDDYIGIGPADGEGSELWQNFTYTRSGSPLDLTMPTEPGDYLITYFLRQDRRPLAQVPISVTDLAGSVTAPAEAVAGSTIEVTWEGPDYEDDYIGIGPADGEGSEMWENFAYTREGSPLDLLVPMEPGAYRITYFVRQDRSPLASTTITITGAEATLEAPAEAMAGSTIDVAWTGPDYAGDYIGIGLAGATSSDQWDNYVNTDAGAPARLVLPPRPGDYVITYFADQDRTPLGTVPITLTDIPASLTAPGSAAAGTQIEVTWEGPDFDGDYIGIGPAGATSSDQWQSYAYTDAGNPALLTLPEAPGDYVIRYFVDQDRTPVAEVPITIE